jgi:alpha-D-ribose 1-methylphosphonate 5-triphosphate synthase subunit PhnL
MNAPAIALDGVSKTFRLHLRGGIRLPVVDAVSFTVAPGEAVVLGGPSGAGKSSVLKMIYGGYRCDGGRILVREGAPSRPHAEVLAKGEPRSTQDGASFEAGLRPAPQDEEGSGSGAGTIDVARAEPREILRLRRTTMAYVSQFLRVIPRVPTLEIVAEPLLAAGLPRPEAEARAGELLERLNLPERLWGLPPATFSGGEQQRVNIARGFATPRPILLLDEPTASLDAANRRVVVELIEARKREGTAILGIFHDADVRDAIADRIVDVTRFTQRSAEAA